VVTPVAYPCWLIRGKRGSDDGAPCQCNRKSQASFLGQSTGQRPWPAVGPLALGTGRSEILLVVKILLVANAHPLQVNPGIGFLRTLEGFSFVSGCALPDNPLVGSQPVLGSQA